MKKLELSMAIWPYGIPNRSVSLSFSFIFLDAGCHASLDASCAFHAKARHKEKQWKA